MYDGKAYRISKTEYLCIAKTHYSPQIFVGIKPSSEYLLYKYDIMDALKMKHKYTTATHYYPEEFIEYVKELE